VSFCEKKSFQVFYDNIFYSDNSAEHLYNTTTVV